MTAQSSPQHLKQLTQLQQGSCTVYIAFYILFQSHLYFITTRTKIYVCSQYFYFPFGSSDNFSYRLELKLTWQAEFISISSAKPFQLRKPIILPTVLRSKLLLILCNKHTINTKSKQTRKYKQGWGGTQTDQHLKIWLFCNPQKRSLSSAKYFRKTISFFKH